jgi:hypothetical protein
VDATAGRRWSSTAAATSAHTLTITG